MSQKAGQSKAGSAPPSRPTAGRRGPAAAGSQRQPVAVPGSHHEAVLNKMKTRDEMKLKRTSSMSPRPKQ